MITIGKVHQRSIKAPWSVSSSSLAVEGEHILLVASYEQSWTVEATGQRVQPGHVERAGTVTLGYRQTPEGTHTDKKAYQYNKF